MSAAASGTGIYVGIQQMEYGSLASPHLQSIGPFSATGGPFSVAAGRMSYTYGLKGPAVRHAPLAPKRFDTCCQDLLHVESEIVPDYSASDISTHYPSTFMMSSLPKSLRPDMAAGLFSFCPTSQGVSMRAGECGYSLLLCTCGYPLGPAAPAAQHGQRALLRGQPHAGGYHHSSCSGSWHAYPGRPLQDSRCLCRWLCQVRPTAAHMVHPTFVV